MPLLDAYVESLREQAGNIEAAYQLEDFEAIIALCRAVEQAGNAFNNEQLSKACRWTLSLLAESGSDLQLMRQSVRELLAVMRRSLR